MPVIRRRPCTTPSRGRFAAPLLAAALVLTGCTTGSDLEPGIGTASAPSPSAAPTTPSAEPGDATPDPAKPDKATPDKATPESATPESAEPSTPKPGTTEPGPTGTPTPTPSGRSGGQTGGEGSEVAPPDSADRSRGDSLGDTRIPSAGRLSQAQETGGAAGLVRVFPDDVVLVPAGAKVASSSVTGADGRFQVTLEAFVDSTCAAVLLDYRVWFTTGGFAETGTTARPRRTSVELTRGDGTVLVDAARKSGGCAVTVFATLSVR